MPNFNFGAGVQANPMDAYNEMVDAVRRPRLEREALEKQGQLSRLLSQAYGTQDDGQRRGMLQQLIGLDPTMGMNAAKALDPRMSADGMPSGLREFNAMTQGMAPEDMARARRIAVGLDPRAVTGAMKFGNFEDDQGRTRPQRNNPTTGQSEIFHAETNQWMPLGGGQQTPAAMPPQASPQQGAGAGIDQPGYGAANMGDPSRFYADVGALVSPFGGSVGSTSGGQHNPGSQHYSGNAVDIPLGDHRNIPREQQDAMKAQLESQGYRVRDERTRPPGQSVWSGPHLHVERGGNPTMPPQQRPAPPSGLGVGMSVEDKAYTTEDAKQRAQLANSGAIGQQDAINAGRKEAATQGAQIDALGRRGEAEATNAGLRESEVVQAKMRAEREGKRANESLDATQAIDLLGGAEKLLAKASGGSLEAGRDRVLSAFNKTTEGSRATAGLKIIAAKLIQKVPRFEGPQSNIDVQSYREAAGDLANDMLPVGQRLAALQTMRQLAKKASNNPRGQQQRPQPASGGWAIQEVP